MDEMISDLWQHISAEQFRRAKDDDFIATFRRPGGANNRLAAWDPIDKTMRYYKSMMFTEAVGKPPRFLNSIARLPTSSLAIPSM
jgi:hypothetical protein